MPEETVSPWLKLTTFVRRGPRYLGTYAAWRLRRWIAARLERGDGWPDCRQLSPLGMRRPLCEWARRAEIVRAVPEVLRSRTIRSADLVSQRSFRYRGLEVGFPAAVDWATCPNGNCEWTWDLNRHHFFVTLGRAYWYTGEERYTRVFLELLRHWKQTNPPDPRGPAWRSVFEVGVRAVNWCWAHALFLPSKCFDDKGQQAVLEGLLAMGRYLAVHIERHAWNNHLLLEAKALAMLGLLYPDFPGAIRWTSLGLRLLNEQIRRQVLPDGVHCERSTLYHEIIASELLEHLVVLRLSGFSEEDPHVVLALRSLEALAAFLKEITRPDGSKPLLGDAFVDTTHLRHDVVSGLEAVRGGTAQATVLGSCGEATTWLLSALGKPPTCLAEPPAEARVDLARHSRAFLDSGYMVLQAPRGNDLLHMVFDCGAFGDPVVPGHGHADALSLDLAVGSSHVVVDPGMYSAHLGARWRNHFRGTSAHSTVVVDGKDQTILLGIRGVYKPAPARLVQWSTCPTFDYVSGEHSGYARLPGQPIHRRSIFFRKPLYWLVLDHFRGKGGHRFEVLFHLHPDQTARLHPDSLSVTARDPNGSGLAILPLDTQDLEAEIVSGQGEGEPVGGRIQGWVSFESGVKEPAPVVCYRGHDAPPVTLATLLLPLFGENATAPTAQRLGVMGAEGKIRADDFVATRLCLAGGHSETILASAAGPPDGIRPSQPGVLLRAGDVRSDGYLASVATDRDGKCVAGTLLGGSRLVWKQEEVVCIEGSPPFPALSFALEDGVLAVHTTGASCMRARFDLTGVERVTVGGTETRLAREGDAAVIHLGSVG